jgi:hypothetical protein
VSYTDAEYLRFDPFDGDRDVDVKCRTTKIVTTRRPQKCHDPMNGQMHEIPAGTRARYETALVDGEWGRYYTCVACMDKWLREFVRCSDRKSHDA